MQSFSSENESEYESHLLQLSHGHALPSSVSPIAFLFSSNQMCRLVFKQPSPNKLRTRNMNINGGILSRQKKKKMEVRER